MTEIAARLPRRGLLAPLLALLAALALAGALAVSPRHAHPHARAHAHAGAAKAKPLDLEPSVPAAPEIPARELPTQVLDAEAARSFDRGYFVASRAGVLATARRAAAWRRLAVRAASGTTVDANLLEAIVYSESGGVAGAIAGDRAGLTQLTPAMARSAGLHVNAHVSRILTGQIRWWVRHGNYRHARHIARQRAVADRRFAPLAELRATVRYLEGARRGLGGTDLAVASMHLGISGLRTTLARFGDTEATYAQLYFGSGPNRHPAVYRRLTAHGQAGYDAYWRVLSAERILRLYRTEPRKLLWEDRQQHRKSSAEEVLHPRPVAHEFRGPAQLLRAWRRHVLVRIPTDTARTHIAVEHLGGMARTYGASPRLYRGLRPGALGVLLLIGRRVHELSGARAPLHLTSAVRDDRYQRALQGVNAFAARTYSLHTTGFTFDLGRATLAPRQERVLRWVLDRLTAANGVAYIEEPYCYHVTVSSRAVGELGVLRAAT
jgi:hypothetical protein